MEPPGGTRQPQPDPAGVTGPRAEPDEGGDPACWMIRVCPECGGFNEDDTSADCPSCGARLAD
jgi:hypothetical protein